MKPQIFVDGQEGTTGLKIHSYLSKRPDLDIIRIDPERRKDTGERRRLINEADVVFLCLPDPAARESASLVSNSKTRIIDASTAFRTDPDWTYGLPELNRNQRGLLRKSLRVSNPGCHATAFILTLYPLVQEGVVSADYPVTCCSVTGYSGAGRRMIETYERSGRENLQSPRHYALKLNHKHVPEMQKVTGLTYPPLFTPIISNYHQGLAVSIPLFSRLFQRKATAADIHDLLASYYVSEPFIRVMPYEADACLDEGFFNVTGCNGTNRADIFVFGRDDQVLLMARIDNLGKGASGAAIQNMNIMLGLPEGLGLEN
ncbi:MAG TPA: N-acetyl-gamma-glutamyl-phosphate reductase [Spirochaetia bacterium]|nr:N-acetyl-gamma-glutamyl-phosphate reductase [Spirochaetia bacterium]